MLRHTAERSSYIVTTPPDLESEHVHNDVKILRKPRRSIPRLLLLSMPRCPATTHPYLQQLRELEVVQLGFPGWAKVLLQEGALKVKGSVLVDGCGTENLLEVGCRKGVELNTLLSMLSRSINCSTHYSVHRAHYTEHAQ